MSAVLARGGRLEDAGERRAARALAVAIHAAARAMRLYPAEHQAVERALSELAALGLQLAPGDAECELRVQGETVFVNGARLRLDLTSYASIGRVSELCRSSGIGVIRFAPRATAREWGVLVAELLSGVAQRQERPADGNDDADRLADVERALARAGVRSFELLVSSSGTEEGEADDESPNESARRTYARSVALTRDVINSVRMGRAPSARQIKRAVQLIVDQVLEEEASLVALTTLREYDEYTYTHSVNVCIFAVALGKRLGMSRAELYELGLAALVHDIGKARVPGDLLRKSTELTEADWRALTSHPWLGVLTLFQLRGQQEFPFRAMVVAHEHHMRCDLSGYPRAVRPRSLAITSRIVAVADGYDAATSRRSYQTVPMAPSAALQEMRDNPRRGLDPVVVKAFINLLGIYPPGTLVVLDTLELAIVRAPSSLPDQLTRPHVLVISDAQGNLLDPPEAVDLAQQGAGGEFARTIIKTTDPDRYGIRVSDYLL